MKIYYSKSKAGFFNDRDNANNLPDDAVEITPEYHVELLDGQSQGKRIVSDDNGFPILVDPPETDPVEPEYFTYKTDIWQRCTVDEAEILDAALSAATAKERRMWEDSITIEHSSEYYTLLRINMVDQFGEARTDEILAPSNA